MTQEQAEKIISFFKEGLRYSYEDSVDSIVYRWNYDHEIKEFISSRQDTIVGHLFPESKYDEAKFLEILENKFEYEKFRDEMYEP